MPLDVTLGGYETTKPLTQPDGIKTDFGNWTIALEVFYDPRMCALGSTFRQLAVFAVLLAASLSSVLGQTPFVPNDPYFNPGTDAGAAPGYYGQWYLENQMPISATNAGLDINIAPVWQQGITGSGVIVGIVDGGFEASHPDLIGNFNNAYSWDFGRTQAENLSDTYRGAVLRDSDFHGTGVAGLVAAQGGNGIGMTGVAPGAQIASLDYNSGTVAEKNSRETLIAAIRYQGQTDVGGSPDPYTTPTDAVPVRVKSYTFGYTSPFVAQDGVADALRETADLGVIHVVSAGNQGLAGGNPKATFDSSKAVLQGSADVINVSALASTGKLATYSSYGANIFVTAPSGQDAAYRVASTDRTGSTLGLNGNDTYLASNGDYTDRFGGTSASAPIVAGVIALGAQVRPDMDVRLAKHALALSSVQVDPSDPSWITNAAGYKFSNKYGFGLIDASAFTQTLQNGLTISAGQTVSEKNIAVGQIFVSSTSLLVSYNANFTDALPVEDVTIHFSISGLVADVDRYDNFGGTVSGDLSAWLTSPSGTRYQLFFNDRDLPWDQRGYSDATLEWDFSSNAYWGESVNGVWQIELDNYTLDGNASWDSFGFEAGLGGVIAVPEPGTWMLFLGGIGGIFVIRRRRQGMGENAERLK